MSLIHYIKLLLQNLKWLVLVPVICAITVFLLTRHAKKQYTSTTTLYTGVASGYSITSTEDDRLDYFAVNNAFDNLLASAKSRETVAEVALHLLSEDLSLTKSNPKILSAEGFESLRIMAGKELLEKCRKLKTPEAIFTYISQVYLSQPGNIISEILNQPGSYYNIDDLKSNLIVTRINTSDIIQIVYNCTDPAVCVRTLQIHTKIFVANYRRLKTDQTNSAVQYFEAQLAAIKAKLQRSEDSLKLFGQQNRIINYYEQTRYISESKEQLDKEIYGQKMAQNGSKDALALVEKKLNSRDKQIKNSTTIINLRQHLSDVNAALERAKIFNNSAKIDEFSARSRNLEDSIKSASTEYNNLNYTLETVPRTNLMQEWVDNAVSSGKAEAGLKVLNNQRQEYLKNFDEFAPLGSKLKRLERQIDINEKEFLSILHGLELAKLRQSNLALNANIAIQDKPFFPLKAQPSTRNLLIIVSFIVGVIMVISTVVGRELMDSSIRTPARAKKQLSLPLAGILIANKNSNAPSYLERLQNMLAEQFISTILPNLNSTIENGNTAQLTFLTTKANIYAKHIIALMQNTLASLFNSIFWVVPSEYDSIFNNALPAKNYSVYTPVVANLNHKTPGELINKNLDAYKLVIYLAPNLSQHSLSAAIAKAAAVSVLVVDANDTWLPPDKEVVGKIKETLPAGSLYSLLINADENNLAGIIGEIPKERSWFRKKVKKVITLNLR
ncbi:hypothetical protein A0256_01205 [Mucilaginibacter sp. PAMC 26640]|nr:hypothetical protein A0256_01205 [Mucilaginibacter sp. PAMC 26640]